MTLIAIKGHWYYPDCFLLSNSDQVNSLVDAADEKFAAIVELPATGTLTAFKLRLGTVTTGATMDFRVEGVTSAGVPDGTLIGANANVAVVVAGTDDNTFKTATLTASQAVTIHQRVAFVAVNPAASFGNMEFQAVSAQMQYPYTALYTGTWARSRRSPIVVPVYGAAVHPTMGCLPGTLASVSFLDSSTPDEIGNRITMPVPGRCVGFWVHGGLTGDITATLYDPDGSTVLASRTVIPDFLSVDGNRTPAFFGWGTTVSLSVTGPYRLTITPGAANTQITRMTVGAAADMDLVTGGQNVYETSRTNAGAWTDTTTQRIMAGLIFDQVDDGATAGGGGATSFISLTGQW